MNTQAHKFKAAIVQDIGVYAIRNLVNNKVYIGSSGVSIKGRFKVHLTDLNNGTHHSYRLQAAWIKYGQQNFVLEVLEYSDDKDNLLVLEQKWMDTYQSYQADSGYNICPTAGNVLGVKMTEETLLKMRLCKLSEDDRQRIIDSGLEITSVLDWIEANSTIDHNGCKIWQGCFSTSGKPVITYQRKQAVVYKLVWELTNNQTTPKGKCCFRTCGERKCVNFQHIELGTSKDITQNIIKRGKNYKGTRTSKIKGSDALEVVELKNAGHDIKKIAEMFGIKRDAVEAILRGENWSNVTGIQYTPTRNKQQRGVSFVPSTQNWRVRLTINGKRQDYGYYETKEKACAVAQEIISSNKQSSSNLVNH